MSTALGWIFPCDELCDYDLVGGVWLFARISAFDVSSLNLHLRPLTIPTPPTGTNVMKFTHGTYLLLHPSHALFLASPPSLDVIRRETMHRT